ncbi:MAG: endo-1,3-alpha-glucanase family glycosylhydrolase [Ignavibacteria bacterium]
MKKTLFTVFFISSLCISQENSLPKIMVHYMPWYQTAEIHGYWGYHWTMNHFNPENILPDGSREIASHYYPLTGPYDSNDELILEYQTLLMKISGIDGVLADWYGIENFWDYGTINESTGLLFNAVEKAGLSFAIVYEDQTIKHMINGGHLSSANALTHAKTVVNYLEDNWFIKNSYLKIDGRPVLLVFGPQYFTKSSDWISIFAELSVSPAFFTLDTRLNPPASGAFPWPPMWKSVNGVLSQTSLNDYLNQFYQNAAGYQYLVTSVFPGFHDIYEEAGVGASYGFLSSQYGQTFKTTMQKALDHNADVIQVATWNDYGEGTIIEPTKEFGSRYLEIIQSVKDTLDSAFIFRANDLLLPIKIYNLRKKHRENEDINTALDSVFNLIISGQREEAASLVDSISTITDINTKLPVPAQFILEQNYPNPFNPSTTIKFKLYEAGWVTLEVFNLLGEEVAVLINKEMSASEHSITFDASELSGGLYIYHLKANGFTDSKKMILLK